MKVNHHQLEFDSLSLSYTPMRCCVLLAVVGGLWVGVADLMSTSLSPSIA